MQTRQKLPPPPVLTLKVWLPFGFSCRAVGPRFEADAVGEGEGEGEGYGRYVVAEASYSIILTTTIWTNLMIHTMQHSHWSEHNKLAREKRD